MPALERVCRRGAAALSLLLLSSATFAAFFAAPKPKSPATPITAPVAPVTPAQPVAAPPVTPPLPAPEDSRSEALKSLDGVVFHDPANPDFGMLQQPAIATQGLPRDNLGFVDWMRALREGQITPRASLHGNSAMKTLDLDVLLKDTKEMPWVKFPHLAHTMWLDCSNCHPNPFVAKAGGNDISMASIFRGQFCGMCHDRVAFVTFFSCVRCHSVPQPPPAAATTPR